METDLIWQLRNRSARTANEIDVLEGLPIRQWRQIESQIGPPQGPEPVSGKNSWPELLMPRNSHLLQEVSQQLLRAARAGRISRPAAPANDDEDGKENVGDDEEAATKEPSVKGFLARKWSQVPRHLEEPEPEYLAKKRKGLPNVYSSWGGIAGPLAQTNAMRKTKVRRFDAEGNPHVYEVLAPKDQRLEGEILPEDESTGANGTPVAPIVTVAPGTVVEGVGVVNAEGVVVAHDLLQAQHPTPPRRKPPPPRKKKKPGPGPGRGHKKKVLFEGEGGEGASGMETPSSTSHLLGVPGGLNASDEANSSAVPSTTGDTPMPDAPEGDDDEDSDEGEDGEIDEDENDGREEGELPPSPPEQLTKNENPPAVEANTSQLTEPVTSAEPATALRQPPEQSSVAPLLAGLGEIEQAESQSQAAPAQAVAEASRSSSPGLPLATEIDSQQPGEAAAEDAVPALPPTAASETIGLGESASETPSLPGLRAAFEPSKAEGADIIPKEAPAAPPLDIGLDLFGSLEKHLESGGAAAGPKASESEAKDG
jgi:hypothetical protein